MQHEHASETVSVRVKICGLTNSRDAAFAVACGADYLGFVMVPQTRRYVSPDHVAQITAALPPEVVCVGVVRDLSVAQAAELFECARLQRIQLHGCESAAVATALGPQRVWKAVNLAGPGDVEEAVAFPAECVVADSAVGGQRGGTGALGDWALAAALAARRTTVLAGGLTPENVAAAAQRVRPYAVDVSSGVEAALRVKDPQKVRAFIEAARSV